MMMDRNSSCSCVRAHVPCKSNCMRDSESDTYRAHFGRVQVRCVVHSATGPKIVKHLWPPRGSLGHRSLLVPHTGTLVVPLRVSACFHLHATATRPPVEEYAHTRPLAVLSRCARGKRPKCDSKRLTG
ncbi:hypothetical protein TRVL_09995 [Trypanosoma vivax]|nr:hypothetical protein TRVL_09995 [Trypanosoma vivax]